MWVTRLDGGPRKVNHSAVTVDDKIFCFGGYCSGEDFENNRPMEIFVLDTETLRWKALPPTGGFHEDVMQSDVPFHRYGHSAVVWKHFIFIWGGRNDSSGACNTLYRYDTVHATWSRLQVHGQVPERRDGHSAAIFGDVIYIFGGFEESGDRFSSDMYAFHISSQKWSYVPTVGERPMPRDFATMEAVGDKLFLWGGRGDLDDGGLHTGAERYENTLYQFHMPSRTWTSIKVPSAPPARRSHASFVYKNNLHIFGGFNGQDHFSDWWIFNPLTVIWSQLTFSWSEVKPDARRRMSCCIAGDRLYMFGGTSPQTPQPPPSASTVAGEIVLHDHDDLFVFEFMPKLKTLAMVAVQKYRLPINHLPTVVRLEFLFHSAPNNVLRQQRLRTGNHSG